jgi:hypothetical protein
MFVVVTQIAVVFGDGLAVPQIRSLLAYRPLDYPIVAMAVTISSFSFILNAFLFLMI